MSRWRGSTLYFCIDDQPKSHLWIVLSEPVGNPAEVVIVPLNSRYDQNDKQRRGVDETVLLQPGDHPFITRPSFVRYSDARRVPVSMLARRIIERKAQTRRSLDPILLERIAAGLLESPFTVRALKRFYEGALENG